MVLRPGAWESSAPPVFLPGLRPRLGRGRGPFLFPRGAEPAHLHAARHHAAHHHAVHLHAVDFLQKHYIALN